MEQMPLKSTGPSGRLVDRYRRKINYLRLSITDRCNLRCFYCMPLKGVEKLPHGEILSYEEFLEVARTAVSLGVNKVRVTGGEPLIKRGAVKLVRDIAALSGVKTVAMTTNGTRLEKYADVLKEAGLKRINISLDSLNSDVYRKITRGGDLTAALRGIDSAQKIGFPIKINAVLIKELNSGEIDRFVQFAIEKGVEVRFIEQMTFEDEGPFVPQDEVLARLRTHHRVIELPGETESPHIRLFDCDGARIGFISPRSHPFCTGCNKLRLTPNGYLRACLASKEHVDMRTVLRRPHTAKDVRRAIQAAVSLKPQTGPWTTPAEMWRVGG
ncbi:MAG: GTP 3',8-cyclase MoaA [Proteobacteria bacterium]|nr:GTP 3',8-cyclase MoaA [Pseudomonadota bacterium]